MGEKVKNSCSLLHPPFQVCLLQFIVTLDERLSGRYFRFCSRKNDRFKVLPAAAKPLKEIRNLIESSAPYAGVGYVQQINDATTRLSGTIA